MTSDSSDADPAQPDGVAPPPDDPPAQTQAGSNQPTPAEVEASAVHAEAKAGVRSFPIVGIGGSAGGLEASSQLLQSLAVDTGMAYVIVQHLAPTHTSMLSEILSRSTSMPVTEVQDEPEVQPDHVYVIPPGRSMVISAGHLKLFPRPEGRGQHRPIDSFLRSLAEDQRHRAIGVILSGTGTDGTLGMTAIKTDGGITFAQDDSAQQTGMPRSAIAEGCVDYVLPPERIAQELARIGKHPYVVPVRVSEDSLAESNINKILRLLHKVTGVDFSNYKSTTLYRRITRRMLLQNMEGLHQYREFLQGNVAEIQALYHDILISVTSFFRDPAAFEVLRKDVFPKLFKDRVRSEPVRVWILGCSTGEEAYSLAITLAEYAEEASVRVPVQIFATDLNELGIDRARAGIYDKSIVQDVSPERLRRFFMETDRGYQISKSIREMCVFAKQNVLTDPPFSRLDLISCRNLLIYLEPVLQRRILPLFHYALRPNGFLWLGSSESIGSFSDRFMTEDARHKIFVKSGGVAASGLTLPVAPPTWGSTGMAERPKFIPSAEMGATLDAQREADRLVLSRYAPCGVVVNREWEIVQFRGDTSHFLAPAPGKPSMNVLKMSREGLLVSLRAALFKARKEGRAVRETGLRVKSNGGFRDMNLEVLPLQDANSADRCFLILFEEAGDSPALRNVVSAPHAAEPVSLVDKTAEIERLTQELAATREYLQSLIEQQDASNEELQSANEEIQSSNEELQSLNEELQTTKEEIQSSNEELTTVNEELRNRNDQLNQSNNDLMNFLSSTNLALVVLGPDLSIRRFTPLAEKLLNLISSDAGRPIDDIRLPLGISNLHDMLVGVIETVTVKEMEVQDNQGRWYSLRIRPYKTSENKIDGAVMVLVDLERQKRIEQQLRASEERYRRLVEGAEGIAIILLDEAGRVAGWNVGAQRVFGYSEPEILGQPIARLFIESGRIAGLPDRELEASAAGRPDMGENWMARNDGSQFWASAAISCLRDDQGKIQGYSMIVRDITGQKLSLDALRESEARYRALNDRAALGLVQIGQDGQIHVMNQWLRGMLGYAERDPDASQYFEIVHPDDRKEDQELSRRMFAGEIETFTITQRYLRTDGAYFWALCSSTIIRDSSGKSQYRLSVIQGVDASKIRRALVAPESPP